MSNLVFLDSVWKCLLTLTASSSLVFSISLFSYPIIKKFSSNENIKWLLNYHSLFAVCSVFLGSIILNYIDPDIVAECFNSFVTNSHSYTITRLLAGGYLIALNLTLAFDGLRISMMARVNRSFRKVENHFVNDELVNLKQRLGIKKPIEILLNEQATSPYVWGLFNHRIVVNSALLRSEDRSHIRTILSHELMHIKGNDSAWLLLSHLLTRVFFFNPMSYIFYAKHRILVEMAADESTIEQCGVDPKKLMKSILEIAESCSGTQNHLLQVSASQEFVEIKERIQSMMSGSKKKVTWVYPTFLMLSITLSILVITIQTKAAVGTISSKLNSGELMCAQIRHEKVLESWLRIESQPNKCEMK